MVQPKQPPLSIRPGDVRLAKIDAYAVKWGLKRHAAVLELLDVALDGRFAVAASRPTSKPIPGSDAAKRKVEAPSKPPIKVSAPYIGDVKRGAYQKRGKGP